MVSQYNSSDPIWLGCKYSPYVDQGYMSGGPGYVLSRAALDAFVNIALKDTSGKLCRTDDEEGAEDVEMGKCLANVNVTAGDSRDEVGRPRFFALVPEQIVVPGSKDPNFWYWKNQFYPAEDGDKCCSNTTIAFHYVAPEQMYVYDFFIYKLRVFGLG
jgi:glycoprotein-N-acetylgalactosamine 3-beta-galactosyltransferase